MADLGFDVWQEDYGASRVDGMRRCNYELSRVMGMRRWLTVMNATVFSSLMPRPHHRQVLFRSDISVLPCLSRHTSELR